MRFLAVVLLFAVSAMPAFAGFFDFVRWPRKAWDACAGALGNAAEPMSVTVPSRRGPTPEERTLAYAALNETGSSEGAMFRADPATTARRVQALADHVLLEYGPLMALSRSVEGAMRAPGAPLPELRNAREALLRQRRDHVVRYERELRSRRSFFRVLDVGRLGQVVRLDPELRLEAARALGRLAKDSRDGEVLQELRPALRELSAFVGRELEIEGLSAADRANLQATALVLAAAEHPTYAAEAEAFEKAAVERARQRSPRHAEVVARALAGAAPLSTVEAQAFLESERSGRTRELIPDAALQEAAFGIDSFDPVRSEAALRIIALRLAYVRVTAQEDVGDARRLAQAQLRLYERNLEVLRDELADRARATEPRATEGDGLRGARHEAQRLVVENDVERLRELLERLERRQMDFDVGALDSPEGVSLVEIARRARSEDVLRWLEARRSSGR